MGKLKSGYEPKGRHKIRGTSVDTVMWFHWSKGSLLETRGFAVNNYKKFDELVFKGEVKEGVFMGKKCYIDLVGLNEWINDCTEYVKPEAKPEEDHIEEVVEKVEEPIGKPKDALEFIRQHKAQQGISAEDFLAELDNRPQLPYTVVDTKKKLGSDKVYEVTIKGTGKTFYGIFAKKYGEDVFIKIAVDDEGMMYKEGYVDLYGEKIE